VDVATGTVALWSDLSCPWGTLAVHRFRQARSRMGLDDSVHLDLRCFPLELVNRRPTPRGIVEAEIPVVGACAPDFGWRLWQGDLSTYPGSVMLAQEAVQAAKEQSLWASEELDYALRRAFFAEGRPISIRTVVLEVAAVCPSVDAVALEEAIDAGKGRAAVLAQWRVSQGDEVRGSPHLFFPDGTDVHNPGIRMRWEGPKPGGFPVIESDDPSVYDDLLSRAK
jgi:predicted DsbA family dithiol-disulfide isomerase